MNDLQVGRVDSCFTYQAVRNIKRELTQQQLGILNLLTDRCGKRKPARGKYGNQHFDHIAHGRIIKRLITGMAHADHTHQVIATNTYGNNPLPDRMLLQHAGQRRHFLNIKNIRRFQCGHQIQ